MVGATQDASRIPALPEDGGGGGGDCEGGDDAPEVVADDAIWAEPVSELDEPLPSSHPFASRSALSARANLSRRHMIMRRR